MEFAGKCIGYAAIIASALIYQQKSRPGLLACKAVSDVLWAAHYLLIGAYTGAAVTAVALVREIVFFNSDIRDPRSRVWLVCFLCAGVLCGVLTWGGMVSLLAMAASLTSIVSFWIGKPRISRLLSIPVAVCMFVYGMANGSVAAVINETIVLISSVVGMLRYDRKEPASSGS